MALRANAIIDMATSTIARYDDRRTRRHDTVLTGSQHDCLFGLPEALCARQYVQALARTVIYHASVQRGNRCKVGARRRAAWREMVPFFGHERIAVYKQSA